MIVWNWFLGDQYSLKTVPQGSKTSRMRCGKGIEAAETLCVIFCPLKLHFSLKNLKTLYGLSFSKLWYQTHSLTASELVAKQTTAFIYWYFVWIQPSPLVFTAIIWSRLSATLYTCIPVTLPLKYLASPVFTPILTFKSVANWNTPTVSFPFSTPSIQSLATPML